MALSDHTGSRILMNIRKTVNTERYINPGTEAEARKMEQHRIAPMLHSNTSIVTSVETSSSSVMRTTLGLHILQT